ncbi:DEAD/DEAH box helicase [Salimicrobium album]|uniref:ATP-dependent RNA helicase CshB n=1 Tax=Salimicrobium album TaxID=50717 RepID=A0A1H3DQN4_9BACI|nr:DEAD/DEAH box helicase [Salimicrobium album]SDX68647.1 ATP-dependent RNA helicase CshB [Salimicrobium album]
MSIHSFDQYDITSTVSNIVSALKFKEPTEIQHKVLPPFLRGESVIARSHTGSGKTHAYLLPIFNRLEADRKVQAVVTAPTRELAMQIHEEVKKSLQASGFSEEVKAKLVVGGSDKYRMMEQLKKTPPQIIVGTPGRILDMTKEGALDLSDAKTFILDEADLMVDLGFIEDVDQILIRMKEDLQVGVFSATIPERLQPFLKKYLQSPVYIETDMKQLAPESMEHRLVELKHKEPADVIIEISKAIQPYLAIIFTNGKDEADKLAAELTSKGIKPGLIHGGLSPRERKRVLKDLKELRFQYIVATDLASRGIDIQGVSHVINAQMPKETEFYLHRVGRTARAGLEGTAINLYKDTDLPLIEKLQGKGLTFNFYEVKKGEWREAKDYRRRENREKQENEMEKKAKQLVRKPKKVKPGYKKKMKYKADKNYKQMKRESYRKGKK